MKNYSRQREEIIKVLKDSYSHPTAEDVYVLVKSKDPLVSRSTVYRNLGVLVDNKLINKISVKNSADRFDYIRDMHNHVICTNCAKVYDFEYDFQYANLKNLIQEQTRVEISESGITIEGICNSCKSKLS